MLNWCGHWPTMMQHYLVRVIRAHWRKRYSRFLAALCAATVLAICSAAPGDPLTDLKSGIAAFESRRYPAAIGSLQPLIKRLPKLADYAAWYLGLSESESKHYAAVPKVL